MRAAIYARYSSDLQSAASIEDQVRLCRERLDNEDWTLVQTDANRAISGASLLRPGLQGLLEDARAARVDVVVAEVLDRLSRDQPGMPRFTSGWPSPACASSRWGRARSASCTSG